MRFRKAHVDGFGRSIRHRGVASRTRLSAARLLPVVIVVKLNHEPQPGGQAQGSRRESRPERKRMPEDKKGPEEFKVVDRRSFGTDGSRLEAQDDTAGDMPDPEVEGGSASAVADRVEPSPALGPVGFQTLVSYLATTAMFQLGLLAGPSGEKIPQDLANARRTLDLAGHLAREDSGQPDPEEGKLLDDVLYELRLSFLEIQKGGSPAST